MATEKLIKEMLSIFSTLYSTSKGTTLDQDLKIVKTYYQALRDYSDKEVIEAGHRAMDECTFLPKPRDILIRIPRREETENDKYLKGRFKCCMCGEIVSAISEGKCLDCAGITPGEEKKDPPIAFPEPFEMHGRMKCQACGTVGLCIKEPAKSGTWKCRDCYSGMTIDERREKIRQIIRSIGAQKNRDPARSPGHGSGKTYFNASAI